jgi:hypothetical protein
MALPGPEISVGTPDLFEAGIQFFETRTSLFAGTDRIALDTPVYSRFSGRFEFRRTTEREIGMNELGFSQSRYRNHVYCWKTGGGPLIRFHFKLTFTSTRLATLMNGMPLVMP